MTPQRLFELAERAEVLKKEAKQVSEELKAVLTNLGANTYHQDMKTGVVYKVVTPTGAFVEYKTIGYERTAGIGESRGTLSKKEAQEKGFAVLGGRE